MKKALLIVEHLLEESVLSYQNRWLQKGFTIDYRPDINQNEIHKIIANGNYDALIVRNKVIDRNILDSWTQQKSGNELIIVRAGSNISTIDVKGAKELDITVQNTPGANSWAVAQYIITQFFMLSNNYQNSMKANNDIRNNLTLEKSIYASPTFVGDKLALIGVGAIGSKVSRIANSLGMHVNAYSPTLTKEIAESMGANYCSSLKEAMTDANFISIQTPFTLQDSSSHPKTFGMINSKVLDLVSDGAKLVNISRKDIVNMDDLLQALSAGKLSNVSLDLLLSEINEIKNDYPEIFNDSNIITPLIACESYKADKAIADQSLEKVEKFFNSQS